MNYCSKGADRAHREAATAISARWGDRSFGTLALKSQTDDGKHSSAPRMKDVLNINDLISIALDINGKKNCGL